MAKVENLHGFQRIKLLADARRLEILRLLMAAPATLSQLAIGLNRSPAWIRHHLKALETADFVELLEIRTTGKVTEKYYRAKAEALLLQELILPQMKKPALVFSGSHDLAVEGIAARLARQITVLTLPVGSLDGLLNLRQGLCQVAGAHLLDESGQYNTPHVKHLFPDRSVELITLAHRTQGLIVRAGNPKAIRCVADLARPGVVFVNRNAGSGTRLWLDMELRKQHVLPRAIHGYDHDVRTHTDAASLVKSGHADAALGLQAAAHKSLLDFIPLFEERYDLVLPAEQEKRVAPMLDYIQSADFRRTAGSLTGYSTAHSGEQIPL